MSFKKYVKHTSLGLALSISATTFAPSMSSAQENSNNVSISNYKAINSSYDVTDTLNFYGYKQEGQQYYLQYGNNHFSTTNPQIANK
ncbi:hypothetical protein [Bacillus mycoides]|uniref:hypothetical protein n=1 Tax=Bacillus mycoides TaxID=1405 RepID=UPI00211137D3|nr:hypothetical protein [Bacillus mycoides]MCQ6531155.1 hypothetical protein [Bacillus mycoides]